MRVCIHQPDFVPYLGFFHRLKIADVFIVLDDVQFLRRGWHHRDQIKTRQGAQWLTLSVQKGNFDQRINEVKLCTDQSSWIDRHLNLLSTNYNRAPFFCDIFEDVKKIYATGYNGLVDLNWTFIKYALNLFNIDIEVVFSSKLAVSGARNERLINLVKSVGGDEYLSGIGARNYMDKQLFEEAHIAVEWQSFIHPVYPQLFGDFIENLSYLDILFNCGAEASDILESCIEK